MLKKILNMGFIVFIILSVFLPMSAFQNALEQKTGALQDKPELHIKFSEVSRIKLNEEEVFFHKIQKVLFFEDKIFILDRRQSKIFAVDKKGHFLYTIGRPGQGPGELEYPAEFTISESDEIYVVNSQAKHLEVFSMAGEFLRRIKLDIPKDIFYSQPWQVLVDADKKIYVTYILSSHLVDVYDEDGTFLENLVMREDPVQIPGKNLGNCSQIEFFEENKILVFNRFSGVFSILSTCGNIERKFRIFDENVQKSVKKIVNKFNDAEKKASYTGSSIFLHWSNFWIDADRRIYVLPLFKDKNDKQNIFCFSPEGRYLYKTHAPEFEKTRIQMIHFFGKDFIFITTTHEMYLAKREK